MSRLRAFCWLIIGLIVSAAIMLPMAMAAEVPQAAKQYRRDLTRNARLIWGINAPVATFAAQIHQESGWKPDARSPYAHGLAQFTPATAEWIGDLDPVLDGADTGNPAWALRALVRYDRWLWDRTKGAATDCDRWGFTLQAYNSGLGWVQKRRRLSQVGDRCIGFACNVNPGVKPENQIEAQNYPRLILFIHEPLYVRGGWGGGVCSSEN